MAVGALLLKTLGSSRPRRRQFTLTHYRAERLKLPLKLSRQEQKRRNFHKTP